MTGLRERRGRVLVELDGGPWRILPAEVVARSGLRVGLELDRARLRLLRRELRRFEALELAARMLRRRDLSERALAERLRGRVAAPECDEALTRLKRAGVVDDERLAEHRAAVLVGRGYGDAAIRYDLSRRGLDAEHVERAVATLEPEATRAAAIVAARGNGAKTARYLSARGFGEEAVEAALLAGFATDP